MAEIPSLWSARHGRGPAAAALTTEQASSLFSSLVTELFRKDHLQEAFGYYCVDEHDETPGTLGADPAAQLLLETGRENLLPVEDQHSSWDQDTLLDAIEVFGALVSSGDPEADGSWRHTWNECGWHYAGFNREPAFSEYRSTVNKILARYDKGFCLSRDGLVERLVGGELVELVEPRAGSVPLEGTDEEHVQAALAKFRRRDLVSRRDAVRDLADVLERLRPHAKEFLGKDESGLFNIANNYWIRHNDPKQVREYDHDVWWDWVFHLYLSSIRLIQALQARAEGENDLLDEFTSEVAGSTWRKGELGRRLVELELAGLPTAAQRRIGTAVGRRCVRQTVVVIADGLEACATSQSIDSWPTAYREGLLDGLLFDADGLVRIHPGLAPSMVRVLIPTPDSDRVLEDLVERVKTSAFAAEFGRNRHARAAASDAVREAAHQLPEGPARRAWLAIADRLGEGVD